MRAWQTTASALWSSAYEIESLSFIGASWIKVKVKHEVSWLSLLGEIGGIKEMLVEGMVILLCLFGFVSVAKGCADGAQRTDEGAAPAGFEQTGQELEMNGLVENRVGNSPAEEHAPVAAVKIGIRGLARPARNAGGGPQTTAPVSCS